MAARWHTLRIPRGQGMLTSESITAYKATLELAKQFRSAGIDILAYGFTAASVIAGPAAVLSSIQSTAWQVRRTLGL